MTDKASYVLGTGHDEWMRLRLQHRLWSNAAHDAWLRAGLAAGEHVLDLGSGPGWASLELAEWVTETGRVTALDASESFVSFLADEAQRRGILHVEARVCDVQRGLAEALQFAPPIDVVWARWLFCFLPSPGEVIEQIALHSHSKTRIVLHDYCNYTAMTMMPRSAAHDAAVAATDRSWRDRGGNPDVMAEMPRLLDRAGFDVTHLQIHQRVCRGGDPVFSWPDSWWRVWAPKLVATGYLQQEVCDTLLAELTAMRSDRSRFLIPPPVTELIATRR
ncbi:MAG: methyltransferase domain-containing protein [Deltaproteobacteria bacterium]|nr:methyltransferase domain-containing protein [Deltaproteobacteria bacterium]